MVVYQELKMIYRVEECAKKHVDFELDENEKADFYLELCKYYEHIGDDQLSKKYAQLAFEESDSFAFVVEEGKISFIKGSKNDSKPGLTIAGLDSRLKEL